MWFPFYSQKRQDLPVVERERQESPRKRARHTEPSQTQPLVRNVAPRVTINSLPPELLMEIFDLAVPADGFLRTRAFSGDDAQRPNIHPAWRHSMAVKRAIPSVCKSWCMMGRRLLYRDVTILDVRGIKALHSTVLANPDLARLIRNLTFIFYIDTQRFRHDQYCPEIADIITNSTALRRVNLFPYGGSWPSNHYRFPRLPPSVISMGVGSHVRLWGFASHLLRHNSNQLQELHIPLKALLGSSLMVLRNSFPQLHTLHLTCSGEYKASDDTLPLGMIKHWDMPNLRRVTFRTRDSNNSPGDSEGLYDEYKYFLRLYGEKLEYIQFP
ncbi:hypothetical protein B0H12DRAFT_1218264, partial [Mycena haematopus]